MFARRSRLALVAAATLAAMPFCADATVTSTSTFERCINDDDNCETKLTMQINLQSGANAGEEVLISQVACGDGACNGASSGELNNTVKLTFYHTRPVLAYDLFYFADFNAAPREAVVYGGTGQDSSGNPTTCSGPGNGMSLFDMPLDTTQDVDQCFGKWLGPTCMDGGLSPDVSCGWLYPQSYVAELQRAPNPVITNIADLMTVPWQSAPLDRRVDRVANVVPDSQGFCCDCDTQHFLFENYDISRGNIACNALDSNSPHASAHCLRMDKLWYSAYDIGQSRENYNIFINVEICDASGNGCARPEGMRITSVGPERPRTVLRNAGNDIRIEWAPFGSADNALDLSSKMLLRPNCHGNADCVSEYAEWSSFGGAFSYTDENSGEMRAGSDINDPNRWLLIPRSDISMTGNDCNQIGLTYAGFRNQGEMKCVRPYDSCLDKVEVNGRLMSSSRIKDYVEADMESAAANSVGRFFPQYVYPGSTLAVEKNGDDYAELKYEVDEYRVSQLTLIMSGELVSVREYVGELDVVDFGLSCMNDQYTPVDCFRNEVGSVESASNDGLLAVTVRNVGDHPDLFTVSFPSEFFEFDNGDGTYTNMAETSNSDISPIQAKSTDQLPGRGANTNRCNPGTQFERRISERATECWARAEEEGLMEGLDCQAAASTEDHGARLPDEGRRLQGAHDPSAGSAATWDPCVQCGGFQRPGMFYPDLRDDCDTVAFQIHSNNGLNRMYCMHVEVVNSMGTMVFPQLKKTDGAEYSHAHRAYLGGSGGEVDTTYEEQQDQGRVCFNTTEIEYVLVGDAEDAFAAGGEPLRVSAASFDCSVFCPTATDLVCMAGQPACSDSLFTVLAVVVAIILFCVIAKKLQIGPFKKKKKVKVKTKKVTKTVIKEVPVQAAATINPVGPSADPETPPAGVTRGHFCPECGAAYAKETKFCPECGAHNDKFEEAATDYGKD
jgi:hypothetical protein